MLEQVLQTLAKYTHVLPGILGHSGEGAWWPTLCSVQHPPEIPGGLAPAAYSGQVSPLERQDEMGELKFHVNQLDSIKTHASANQLKDHARLVVYHRKRGHLLWRVGRIHKGQITAHREKMMLEVAL
ncbi:hypothetical protein DPEC_G00004430 [Dallia pectoralis]|uniref:Uncharacterized protein n=1 Tax=Dallia pectoralis TaxID=75939 RepID=A0ACC2HJT8_DALPE|nr:hypothetical protein DPEC_G00004430 [Dallia pectoralis]